MAVAFLVLLLLVYCAATSAAIQDEKSLIIPVSSDLEAGTDSSSVWLSPSKMFAFGFYDTPNGYAVGIFLWNTTVVWLAKEINPIFPHDVNYLLFMDDKIRLFQSTHEGGRDFYYDIVNTEETIAGASMLDNGNFVLYNSDGAVIWQSFDYPTHTLLPGQRLRAGQELFSRASETNLDRGKFRLKMQIDGNLVQYPVATSDTHENAYYQSNTYGAGNNLSLVLDNDSHVRLYLYDGNSMSIDICRERSSVAGGNTMYLARLDPDGIFRLYNRSLEPAISKWTWMWRSTEDKCAPKGICGDNSFCALQGKDVTCKCLPANGDGCKDDFEFEMAECGNKNASVRYEMRRMENVTWQENYYRVNDTITEQDCERLCLDDCDCNVALFQNGECHKQKTSLIYGRMSPNYSNVALVRVSLPSPATTPTPVQAPNASGFGKGIPGQKKGIYVIIGVPIGIAALVISTIIIIYLTRRSGLRRREDEENKENVDKLVLNHGSLALKRYSYNEIRKITKSFAEKLGQGGYGIVYKGKLHDGNLVAVKVLKKTHDNADEFLNEVASISRTSHVNIVNLLGFCLHRKKRALVYEFMPNNSLDKFIKKCCCADAECSLEWTMLYEIAVGVARGLEYLHRGCNTRIVHFDIKPQNILLDQDFCPKISDFGLAKLCRKKQSVISMLGTRGTIGYIAPEVYSRNFGLVSHKSDVYSYGIMLLQMVKARTNVETKVFQSNEDYFLEKIYEHVVMRNERIYATMTEEEEETGRKMLLVGFWCMQTAPSDRPSMNKVVDMLEGNVQSIQIPPLPFLLSSPKQQLSCLLLPMIVETQSSCQ